MTPALLVGMPSTGELILILAIVLLVFGANKLPQLGEGVGKAIKNFKRGISSDDEIDVTPEKKQVGDKSSASSVGEQVEDADVVKRES